MYACHGEIHAISTSTLLQLQAFTDGLLNDAVTSVE